MSDSSSPSSAASLTSFPYVEDRFSGVTIDLIPILPKTFPSIADYPTLVEEFRTRLLFSLNEYKTTGKRGCWFKIPIAHSHLIPTMAEVGFKFHHSRDTYSMLNIWLPHYKTIASSNGFSSSSETPQPAKVVSVSEPNKLPQYASTSLGIGGLVLNDAGEVLLVQEKWSVGLDFWKLPGGLVDRGESLTDGVIREVREETGIEARFVSILGFRHALNFAFNTGDIYFFALMRPVLRPDGSIPPIRKEESEILDAKWSPLNDWLASPSTQWFATELKTAIREAAEKLLKEETKAKDILKSQGKTLEQALSKQASMNVDVNGVSDIDKFTALLNAANASSPNSSSSSSSSSATPVVPASSVVSAPLISPTHYASKGRPSPLTWKMRYSPLYQLPTVLANGIVSGPTGVQALVMDNETLKMKSLMFVAATSSNTTAPAAQQSAL